MKTHQEPFKGKWVPRVLALLLPLLFLSLVAWTGNRDGLNTRAGALDGLVDNTLVIFSSDNGGAPYVGLPDINQPYRWGALSKG